MAPKARHSVRSPLAGLVCAFLMVMMTGPGCGKGEYSKPADTVAAKTDTAADTSKTVRENWGTLPAIGFVKPDITYQYTAAKADPVTLTGELDSVGVNLALVENGSGAISANGILELAGDAFITTHPFSLSFTGESMKISEKSLIIKGSGHAVTQSTSGEIIEPLCTLTLEIKDVDVKYICSAHMTIEDLGISCDFNVDIYRTGDQGIKLSFVNSKWKHANSDIVLHYPKRQYTDQTEITGIPSDALFSVHVSGNAAAPMATGSFSIPSEMSPNTASITIPFTAVPAQLNESSWLEEIKKWSDDQLQAVGLTKESLTDSFNPIKTGLFKFMITGTIDTMALDGVTPINTPYNLTVSLIKNVSIRTTGFVVNYTLRCTLFLDKIGTRTYIETNISRTDSSWLMASLLNGSFILPGGKSYDVTNAQSSAISEDTVTAPAEKIGYSLALTQGDSGPVASGSITLPSDVRPAFSPALSITFSELPAVVSNNTITINQYVDLEKTDSLNNTTSIAALLKLTIKDSVCSVEITGDDLKTSVTFSTAVKRTDSGTDLSGSTWKIEDQFTLTCQNASSNTTDVKRLNEKNLSMSLVLSNYADYVLPFTPTSAATPLLAHASGNISLNSGVTGDAGLVLINFSDAAAVLSDDGKSMTIKTSGSVSPGTNVTYTLEIVLNEKDTGGYQYQVTIGLPGSQKILKFTIDAIRSGGSGFFLDGEQAYFIK